MEGPGVKGGESFALRPHWCGVTLALILAGSFALKLRHLDHAAVKPLDEVFHAVVARNFLHHPLTPTLVDQPFLPYDRQDWLSNHIWLHKPPMGMWQIAISFAILGVNTFALRLPSAILSTLAAWLTYAIGCRLLDRTAGLIAAALQAFNPVILMVINGYVFSDHVDISLLFWTELAIYFLVRAVQSKNLLDAAGCGVFQGLAFLSKTYPALIVTVLALACLKKIGWKRVLVLLLGTATTTAPWLSWTAIRFPVEFQHENLQILHHLSENVENWAAPWDQVVFYYWISVFHVYYPAIVAAGGLILYRAVRQRQFADWFLLLWVAGVAVPNLLATSKPMTATLIGWPAAWLMLGDLISRALRGERLALGTWFAAVLLAAIFLNEKSIPVGGENWGKNVLAAGAIMRQHLWVIEQAAIAILVGALCACVKFTPGAFRLSISVASAATLFLALAFAVPRHASGYGVVAWRVTSIDAKTPDFRGIGIFAGRLPGNAAFLVDEQERLENKLVEFATDRSCYAATAETWTEMSRQLEQAGALPYLVSPAKLDLPVAFVDRDTGRTVYACDSAALAAAGGR
jgi:4-amino-4-deoxy-L-arabinose transferase-like glycosyltransferase